MTCVSYASICSCRARCRGLIDHNHHRDRSHRRNDLFVHRLTDRVGLRRGSETAVQVSALGRMIEEIERDKEAEIRTMQAILRVFNDHGLDQEG